MQTNEKNETQLLEEALATAFQASSMAVEVLPLPQHGDRIVRLRTLEEALEEFDSGSQDDGTSSFLVQIKRKRTGGAVVQVEASALTAQADTSPEAIYLPNGKLNVAYLSRNAQVLLEAGEYTLARNIFHSILTSGERPSLALHGIGRCLEGEGKLDEAKTRYEEAIAYQPSQEAYRALAGVHARQGKEQRAAEIYERALHLKDLSIEARTELHKLAGNSWFRCQQSGDAERNYKKALEISPSNDELRTQLGALYLQAGKLAEAQKSFQDAVASNPKNAKALAGLGSCWMTSGDKKQAHDAFSQSLTLDINNPTAVFYLVKCAYEIKSYAAAARFVEEYIEVAPVNANLLYSLAGLQFHLGRIADARSTTDQILGLSPDHAGAKELKEIMSKY